MTTPDAVLWFGDQFPPDVREQVAKAFDALDAMGENSNFGTGFQKTFSFQASPPVARSNYWARWEYSPEEWKLFDRLDWGKAWHRFLLFVSITALLYIGIVSFFEMVLWSSLSDVNVLFPALFVPVIVLLPAFLLAYFFVWLRFREARLRHSARQNGPRRVTIGSLHLNDQDMWLAGSHVPLQELFVKLLKVKLSTRPPLVLSLRRRLSIRTGSGSWRDTIFLPVPRGREDEAGQLVECLRSQTIGASKRKYVPAEPE